MAEFDIVAKQLIQTYPTDFARFALQRDDVQSAEVIETEQPTTRHADSLLRVHVGGRDVLVHHEFQTTDSTEPMPERMAGYMGWCIQQYRLTIYSNVIYLRPNAGRRDPGYILQDNAWLRYRVIRLSELDGQRMLDAGHLGWLPFAPLMQPPAGVDDEGWVRQCVNRAYAVPMDETRKADYLGDLAILGGLVYNLGTLQTIISEKIMYESSVVQHFTEKALQEGIKQGLEQGIEQGIERGLERGSRERAIEDLLDVLELRFGLVASDPLVARIGAIKDVQRLKQLFRAAVQVPSLEAFSSRLDADA